MDGKRFPMEAHFVHKAANGDGLSVVGVFIVEGAESPVLAPIWAALPEEEGEASIDAPAGFTVLSAVRAWALCMMALEDVGGSMLKNALTSFESSQSLGRSRRRRRPDRDIGSALAEFREGVCSKLPPPCLTR